MSKKASGAADPSGQVLSEKGMYERSDSHPRHGTVPSDWATKELQEIGEVVGGSTPSTSNEEFWGGGIPWVTPTEITEMSGVLISKTERTLSQKGLESASTHLLPPFSVLMTSRATIGECAINTIEMATNQGFQSVIPDVANPWYLYYRLTGEAPYLESLGSGNTFDEVSKTVVEEVEIPLPPPEEQRKIASVLNNIDQVIQKTDEVRSRLERIKDGLSIDLFHTGIGGQETKEGWGGEVPADWDVVQFSEIIDSIQNGIYKPSEDYGGPYPIIKMGDVFGEVVLSTPVETVELTEDEAKKYETLAGDLVFARHAQKAWGAGDCTLVPNEQAGSVVESNLYRVRLTEGTNPRFYAEFFNSPVGTRLMKRIRRKSNITQISQSDLKRLRIPLPPKEEQDEIASILRNVDNEVQRAKEEKNELSRLKTGLMQDLLSSEIRTHDKDIEVLPEVKQHG